MAEFLFRPPVIQREKAQIRSNISYQLRSDVPCGATEETRPCSLRPVLLNKLCFLLLPNPKLPDDHVLRARSHLGRNEISSFIKVRRAAIERTQKRFFPHQIFIREPFPKLLNIVLVALAKQLEIPVRLPVVEESITPVRERTQLQLRP